MGSQNWRLVLEAALYQYLLLLNWCLFPLLKASAEKPLHFAGVERFETNTPTELLLQPTVIYCEKKTLATFPTMLVKRETPAGAAAHL